MTAEGAFLDRGTTYVHVDRFTTDIGFPSASFSETFESSLTEPIRVPTSAQDCKDGGCAHRSARPATHPKRQLIA